MAGDKNSILKYIIAILVILAINIGLGYFIATKILDATYNTEDLDTISSEDDESDKESGDSSAVGTLFPLDDPITLNPYNSSGEIFVCDIVLESKDEDVTEFTDRKIQIMGKLSSYLAMKTVQELSHEKQWDNYRREMLEIVNEVLKKSKVINVYIKQKLIQYD